jgi:hypothetical protein
VQERFDLDYDYDGDKDPESWLKSFFPARYIYEYQLPKIVEEEDPGAIYHPGSPWGDGKTTSDTAVGDTHQWGSKAFFPMFAFSFINSWLCSVAWSYATIPRTPDHGKSLCE